MGSSAYGGGVASFGSLVSGPAKPANIEYPNSLAVDNGSNVSDSDVEPQVDSPTPGAFVLPNTGAPSLSTEVAASSSLAEAPPNQIEVVEGQNVQQPGTANPVS